MTSSATNTWFACARCGQHKPAWDFPRNAALQSGIHSWCKNCMRDYQRQYHHTRPPVLKSPYVEQAAAALKKADAVEYSRAVCEHVAWYVQRKIAEFEADTAMEAPPHLPAILTIAKSISAQHPPRRRRGTGPDGLYILACTMCENEFLARSPGTQYCDSCRPKAAKEWRTRYRSTDHGRELRRQQKIRARQRQQAARLDAATRNP